MRSLGAGENNVVLTRHGGPERLRGVAEGNAVGPIALHSRGRHGPYVRLKLVPSGTACLAGTGGRQNGELKRLGPNAVVLAQARHQRGYLRIGNSSVVSLLTLGVQVRQQVLEYLPCGRIVTNVPAMGDCVAH